MYSNQLSGFKDLAKAYQLKIAVLQSQEYLHPELLKYKKTAGELVFGKKI